MEQEKLLNKYLNSTFTNTGTLYELLNDEKCEANDENFIVPIGRNETGMVIYQDLSQISHILISGTTGGGKTAFIQSVLSSLMLTLPPDNVKFIIYDSKHIDYMFLQGIPQLLIPIITDSKKALGAISWAVSEANNRISLRAEKPIEFEKLPHIFMVFDDYSEVAMYNEGIEYLVQLLKVGRMANIHCILATSTPTSSIVSTEIKANVPCRISFHTTQKSVSRMILDENGAELLQIPGEMIFKGQNQNVKCTSFYVSDEEIKSIVDTVKKMVTSTVSSFGEQASAVFGNKKNSNNQIGYNADVIEFIMKDERRDVEYYEPDVGEEDSLLFEATELAAELGQISTAIIQRRLKIGYARAGRIIDQMEAKGIISGADGSKPRDVLITKDKFLKPNEDSLIDLRKSAEIDTPIEEVIQLRPFPKIEGFGESIEVKNNLICVNKSINITIFTTLNLKYSLSLEHIRNITYYEPKVFAKGSISFELKENINITAENEELYKKYQSQIPKNKLTIQFSKNHADLFKHLVNQISQDANIDVQYR